MMEKPYKLINGDALEQVKRLDAESVDCVISSPPYYQLRNYNFDGQWGLESTFQAYLEKLWTLMDEVWRVIKPTGTAWINLGDTYGTQSGGMRQGDMSSKHAWAQKIVQPKTTSKCLLMIPHRFAIGCSERGWLVRNDCVWAKRNGMPESVTDRFSKKHEYFFLMAKQAKYYFDLDAIRDEVKLDSIKRELRGNNINKYSNDNVFPVGVHSPTMSKPRAYQGYSDIEEIAANRKGKNPGSVSDFWDIPTRPSSAKHYATFNTELIDKPIKAGCAVGGTILDMFCGTATTGIRALQLDRKFIGIDGNADYLAIAEARIEAALNRQPLFAAA